MQKQKKTRGGRTSSAVALPVALLVVPVIPVALALVLAVPVVAVTLALALVPVALIVAVTPPVIVVVVMVVVAVVVAAGSWWVRLLGCGGRLWLWLWLIERGSGLGLFRGDAAWPEVPWVLYAIFQPGIMDRVAKRLSVSSLLPQRSGVRIPRRLCFLIIVRAVLIN